MRVIIEPNYELASQWAANYVTKKINEFGPSESKPFLLGLPTGSSPLGMYKELIKLNKAGTVTFEVADAVKQLKAGRIEFRTDKFGNVHATVGKLSFKEEQLVENIIRREIVEPTVVFPTEVRVSPKHSLE